MQQIKKWHLKFNKSVKKDIKKLDDQARKKILDFLYNRITPLEYPESFGKELSGNWKGYWRYRVGKYRIICDIKGEVLTIMVIKIGKRDQVYKD